MDMSWWIEALGWVGSGALVIGLLQKQMIRLRVVSLGAAVVLVAYNALIESWPMVAMNVVIFVINSVRLRDAIRERNATAEVVAEVTA